MLLNIKNMECAICYETFFIPKNKAEFENFWKENVPNDSCDEIMRFRNLLITSKCNNTHSCSIPNCECLICGDCWGKITHKDDVRLLVDDLPSMYDYFKCPYCREVDWKDYMHNVLFELQKKVLGGDEAWRLRCIRRCYGRN